MAITTPEYSAEKDKAAADQVRKAVHELNSAVRLAQAIGLKVTISQGEDRSTHRYGELPYFDKVEIKRESAL